jgi:hypothetical protein
VMELGSKEAITWTRFKEEFLSGILMELKEEYTLRVAFQQETESLVP